MLTMTGFLAALLPFVLRSFLLIATADRKQVALAWEGKKEGKVVIRAKVIDPTMLNSP